MEVLHKAVLSGTLCAAWIAPRTIGIGDVTACPYSRIGRLLSKFSCGDATAYPQQNCWIVLVFSLFGSQFQFWWTIATGFSTACFIVWRTDNSALIQPITAWIWSLIFLSQSRLLLKNVANGLFKPIPFDLTLGLESINSCQ
jgi:hypothetical protein